MKKIVRILFMSILVAFSAMSCNYLDVVPDETPTEDDAFEDERAAERFIYGCYGSMQKERLMILTSGEVIASFDSMLGMALGNTYTAADPGYFNFWSRWYGVIRRCYILLDNIDNVPGMKEQDVKYYKGEAKFLIAYHHFLLMRSYGPIIIADHLLDASMSANEMPERAEFDDCVDFIAKTFDEAAADLPVTWKASSYGRATKVAALAFKAKALVYAASPLFNGNSKFYKDFVDKSGKHLMPLEYDASKWLRAVDACKDAVEAAEAAGIELYYGTPSATYPQPEDPVEFRCRMNFIDPQNNEVIWADTRSEDYYDYQNSCTPRHPDYGDPSWNAYSPTWRTVKMFYTKNGLPIDEDPEYIPESEYFNTSGYDDMQVANIHLGREPRFNAWIGFHGGWYEMNRDDDTKVRLMFRRDDVHGLGNRTRNYTITGYLVKKGVGPRYCTEQGGIQDEYSWPLMRLADLYLLYAEALIESGDLQTGMTYLNKVRQRAGIPNVETSWKGIATLNQDKLREIVRRERCIEMFNEGQYFWDVRRWLVAEDIYSMNPEGLNIQGETDSDFNEVVTIGANWGFKSPTNYLWPIKQREINIDGKLVQNPGY